MENKNKKRGFTLVELLVSIAVMGVLAGLSLATYGGYQQKAKKAKNEYECAQIDHCNKTKDVCEEAGDTPEICDNLCDIRGLYCEGIGMYPPESYWTDASCFTFASGTISAYDEQCGGYSVVIPMQINGEDVTTIGNQAFYNKDLTSINIPDTVTTLETYSFGQNELSSVFIPEGLTTIGYGSFINNELTSISLSSSVSSIDNYAFLGNQLTSVTIPDGVSTISYGAFFQKYISSISLPSSVTSFGPAAFSENNMSSLVIQDGVTSIGNGSFNWNQFTSIYIPDSVSNIDIWAFNNNPITSVSLKAGTNYSYSGSQFGGSFPSGCTVASGCITERP